MAVDATTFKQIMSRWASGVTVVTTEEDGQSIGVTASSFISVSLQPPLVLVSIDRKLGLHDAILRRGAYAVNILSQEQEELGRVFAGLVPERRDDKFAGLSLDHAPSGIPVLHGTMGWLDCRLWNAYDGGDHTLFVGEVLDAHASFKQPLLYFARQWGRFESFSD